MLGVTSFLKPNGVQLLRNTMNALTAALPPNLTHLMSCMGTSKV
jgi:hypothetical protein